MSSSKIYSAAVAGIDADLVEVEADTGGGEFGQISVVGLPDAAVSESRERVRSAVKNSELQFPKIKVTVNLAPADLKKQGPHYDLPIAISVLLASDNLKLKTDISKSIFLGELALSGDVRSVNGVLPISIMAKDSGFKTIYVPAENAKEAKLIKELEVIPIKNLKDIFLHLAGIKKIEALEEFVIDFSNTHHGFDMENIQGQEHVKRAMEIAAAGAHNMLMHGPPGSGKTLLARTIPTILPDLTLDEALEVTKIYSVAGQIDSKEALLKHRPFRSPHHTASGAAMVGGGAWPKPGEISLSHRGVLFMDEFGEYPRNVLESLRQPMEDGVVNISRVSGNLRFPAKFILVAATNPCPCGFYGDQERSCICSPSQIITYKKKISGPIADRIDIHTDVPRVDFEKLTSVKKGEASSEIKKRVELARQTQRQRFEKEKYSTNAEMSSDNVKKYCEVNEESKMVLKNAVDRLHMSARAYFRVLKLARTIADLESSLNITTKNIAEALQYRPKET